MIVMARSGQAARATLDLRTAPVSTSAAKAHAAMHAILV
jgi:hypothetical protein